MSLYRTNRVRSSHQAYTPGRRDAQGFIVETAVVPGLPEIGCPETYYASLVRQAERASDPLCRDAAKAGQYTTLGLNQNLAWPEKLRYFQHALQRHCVPPEWPGESVWLFYQSLANLVREYAGVEALRLASVEDDLYAARQAMGATRERIENDAEQFFSTLVSSTKPDWLNEMDYRQLVLIRDQWI